MTFKKVDGFIPWRFEEPNILNLPLSFAEFLLGLIYLIFCLILCVGFLLPSFAVGYVFAAMRKAFNKGVWLYER
jgi:hypothetical protein